MSSLSRRAFLHRGAFGLAAAGVAGLVLRAGAEPTESSGGLGQYEDYLKQEGGETVPVPPGLKPPAKFAPTDDNILGPYYRKGAPFRAKVTPPLAGGTVLLVSGRVWGHDTRRPLAGVVLDVWQADHAGRYDNDDPAHPPAPGVFVNRVRLVTDEGGYYEYETIHPGKYKIGPETWRPSHIHYLVRHAGYRTLVTQLYFAGDA